MNNPKVVLEQIVDSEENKSEKVIGINPLTISRYAYLELIDSPFLSTAKKFDMQNIITSAYIMVQPTSVLKKYKSNNIDDLIDDALDWADANLEFDDISKLIEAIINQITKLNKVAPTVGSDTDVSDENGKKK